MIEFFKRHALVIAIVGSIASVISIPLAIGLYAISIRNPAISYATKDIKIYDSSSKVLDLMIKSQKIESDVYAFEIVLWNSGSAPVDPSLIRQFPTLSFEGAKSLIAIQDVRSTPAPFVSPDIELDQAKKSVAIKWKTLDPGAAIKLSLLYSSDMPIGPVMQSRIVGVEPTQYSPIFSARDPGEPPREMTMKRLLLAAGIATLLMMTFIGAIAGIVLLASWLVGRTRWSGKLRLPTSILRGGATLLAAITFAVFVISVLYAVIALAHAFLSGGIPTIV